MVSRTVIYVVIFLNFCAKLVQLNNTKVPLRRMVKTPSSKLVPTSPQLRKDDASRIETIKTSPKDYHSYRALRLSNGMNVLLISDPSTEETAGCMAVGVGTLYDEPGLANLTAQVVMMGSKKYRKHYGLENFLLNNGGEFFGPEVTLETTSFSFAIHHTFFAEVLDKFAQNFLKPLLSYESQLSLLESFTRVEAQHTIYETRDEQRIPRVEISVMAESNHPINNFKTGNFNTSTYNFEKASKSMKGQRYFADVFAAYRKVKNFYTTYYSSNIMRLVVLGRDDLDSLEKRVTSLFKNVIDRKATRIRYEYSEHPFLRPGKPKHKIYVVPLDERTRTLHLCFPAPDFRDQYNTAFDIYVKYVMKHEGTGSLKSLLQTRGLCTDLKFSFESPAGIGLANIIFILTKDGLQQVDYIINRTFEYIRMLEADGINKWLFDELLISNKRAFLYYTPTDDPVSLVTGLALELLNDFPMETTLTRNYYRDQWDDNVIREFISYLRPDNMNVTIISPSFAKFAHQTETNYGTKYKAVEITEEMIKEWKKPPVEEVAASKLRLPSPNKFIPETFQVDDLDEKESLPPRIIHQSRISEIWFKQDDKFRVPELQMRFLLFSSITRLGPFQHTLWRIFYALLLPVLEECLYSAEVSGVKWVEWSLELNVDDGMEIEVHGLSDKLPLLLEIMLSKITNFEDYLEESAFNRALKEHRRRIGRDFTEKHDAQIAFFTNNLTKEEHWDVEAISSVCKILQFSDMKEFLQKVFRRIFIRGFIHGNCTKNVPTLRFKHSRKALDIVSNIEATFEWSLGLLPSETLGSRFIELENKSRYIYQTFNKLPKIYGYSSYFQFNTEPSNLNDVIGLLLQCMLPKQCKRFIPALSEDQPAECLYAMDTHGVRGFFIMTLSKETPRQVDRQVEALLRDVADVIRNTIDDEFNSYKRRTKEFLVAGNLFALSEMYWHEIENRFYEFDRMETKLKLLHTLERSHISAFVGKMLNPSSTRLRKLSVWVLPKSVEQAHPNRLKSSRAEAIITDVFDFRNTSTLLSCNSRAVPAHLLPRPDKLLI